MAFTWKEILLFIASLLLIVVVLIQDSKSDSASSLTGEKNGLFSNQKARGFDKFMLYLTLGVSVLFVLFAVLTIAIK